MTLDALGPCPDLLAGVRTQLPLITKRIADNTRSDKDSVTLAGKRNPVGIVGIVVAIGRLIASTVTTSCKLGCAEAEKKEKGYDG